MRLNCSSVLLLRSVLLHLLLGCPLVGRDQLQLREGGYVSPRAKLLRLDGNLAVLVRGVLPDPVRLPQGPGLLQQLTLGMGDLEAQVHIGISEVLAKSLASHHASCDRLPW